MKFILVLAISLLSYEVHDRSLCKSDEKVIWSCKTQEGTYAVCASNDLSKSSGYMQYRSVKHGKDILSFPSSPAHPKNLFRFGLQPRGAVMSFSSGGHTYELYEWITGEVSFLVSENNNPLCKIECDDSDYTLTLTETIRLLHTAGVGK